MSTRQIMVGGVPIGGGAPIVIQSMCNTDTRDVQSSIEQINTLAQAGCQVVRLAVPDWEAAQAIGAIVRRSPIPVVADIHFDYRLALECCRQGVHKIRINPGNIGGPDRVKAVADACRERGIPIRVGVNGGSIDRDIRENLGVTPEALCQSAQRNIRMLEDCGFTDICVSLKASSVFKTIEAYRLMSCRCDYPLHLGVTEAGTTYMGTLKSAAAFGALLMDGIGDTLRVSLTADPVHEIEAARDILKALDLHTGGVTVVSCPTCGRTQVDLIPLAERVECCLSGVRTRLTVAVMGCAVNGPGEAREADLGIAGGRGEGLLFRKGEIIRKVPEAELFDALMEEVRRMTGEEI